MILIIIGILTQIIPQQKTYTLVGINISPEKAHLAMVWKLLYKFHQMVLEKKVTYGNPFNNPSPKYGNIWATKTTKNNSYFPWNTGCLMTESLFHGF